MKSVRINAKVLPHLHGKIASGVVPEESVPGYAAFRRWGRDRLAPLPGVEVALLKEAWDSPESDFQVLEGAYWFGGHLDDRFGHFLTESITRVWWHLQNENQSRVALFVPVGNKSSDPSGAIHLEPLKSWQLQILDYLGIDKIKVIDRPVIVEDLLIPEPGALLFSDVHECDYLESLYQHNLKVQGPRKSNRKIFLSRPDDIEGGVIGEEILSSVFRNAGYDIVAPESLSILEQLDLMRNASHVVGAQGSALHLFNLIGKSPQTKVMLFQRLGDFSSNAFDITLRPYVGDLEIIRESMRFRSDGGSNFDYTVPDVDRLAEVLAIFDPSVDVDSLTKAEFFDAICEFATKTRRLVSFRKLK